MSILHSLSSFVSCDGFEEQAPTYTYEGRCTQTGAMLGLPRTRLAEEVARGLMAQLAAAPVSPHEGKMYGVLVVQTASGGRGVLKAFAGQLAGKSFLEGWVPPLPGHEHVALDEARTLEELTAIKDELVALAAKPAFADLVALREDCDARYEALCEEHKRSKARRKQRREALRGELEGEALEEALGALARESHEEKLARRDLRRAHTQECAALTQEVASLREEIAVLKQRRKRLSRELQAQMHAVYTLANFAGEERPLAKLVEAGGLPSGTGDCCAPKLLHFAAVHGFKPLGLAEFWWGAPPPGGGKEEGRFYGACAERCQPIMGFLLAGLGQEAAPPAQAGHALGLEVLYEDAALIVVDKPAGLLSMPGRTSAHHDSVVSRARHLFPDATGPIGVHRLDMNTSGLLLLARTPEAHRALSAQFRQRKVHKVYQAIVCGVLAQTEGELHLPLAQAPEGGYRQWVDHTHGKPSTTRYRVLEQDTTQARVMLEPLTGRTHQLRVHCAHPAGLNAPILGDPLYAPTHPADRLHLHAHTLSFTHPTDGHTLSFEAPLPF